MRALCGAIITAGALIGLGLAAIGIGTRYHEFARYDTNPPGHMVQWQALDHGLLYAVVFLSISAVIGFGIAFLGLAFHHHRRHHEFLRDHGHHSQQPPSQPRVLS
jgi:hypothetical protein